MNLGNQALLVMRCSNGHSYSLVQPWKTLQTVVGQRPCPECSEPAIRVGANGIWPRSKEEQIKLMQLKRQHGSPLPVYREHNGKLRKVNA